jgi:hypothetical protein
MHEVTCGRRHGKNFLTLLQDSSPILRQPSGGRERQAFSRNGFMTIFTTRLMNANERSQAGRRLFSSTGRIM